MKLYRNAIILVVILGLLVAAYFFINNQKNAANDDVTDITSTDDTIKILDLEKDKINLMEFNNENGNFSLKKQGEEWVMEPAAEFPTNSSTAESSTYDMATLVAQKVIEENAADLNKYGLDKPDSVTIGLTDGTSKVLELGSNSPTNDGIYVKLKGESKVYLIGSYYESYYKKSINDFIKKDILPVEANTLKKFAYEKNGELQYAIDVEAEGKLKITAPINEEGEASKIAPMLEAVVQLTVNKLVDGNPADLAKYGLDKPAYTLEFSDGTTTKKILFGKVESGEIRYAKYPDSKSVFTIDTTPLNFLDVKLRDILSVFVYLPNIGDVNKIELFIDGKTIVSDIKTDPDDKDKDEFKVDGKNASIEVGGKNLFRSFYQAMIGVTMAKYEPDANPNASATPEVTIKYYMKPDSKPVTIDFISKDSNYYYAMKDGVYTNRVILKAKLDEKEGIRDTYAALKKAIDEAK